MADRPPASNLQPNSAPYYVVTTFSKIIADRNPLTIALVYAYERLFPFNTDTVSLQV
jgi:hypothetical protein